MGQRKDLTEDLIKTIEILIDMFKNDYRDYNIDRKVASVVKVSETSVRRIHKTMDKGERYGPKRELCGRRNILSAFDRCVIRRLIYNLKLQNVVPHISKIMCEWNKHHPNKQCGRLPIWNCLNKINFDLNFPNRYRKIPMENTKVIKMRHKFLKDIKKFRKDGWNTTYLTAICNKGFMVVYDSSGKELTFKCAQMFEMVPESLINWFKNFITNLKYQSVIIMDVSIFRQNARSDKLIMSNLNVQRTGRTSKSQLEFIAQSYNHCILWLPPMHNDLNPTEFVWFNIKNNVTENFSLKMRDIDTKTFQSLKNASEESWIDAMSNVLKIENEYQIYKNVDTSQ